MYTVQSRDGIHESTISLRFLEIILKFLRLEVSTVLLFLPFYKMLFMNKLEFTSLVDCFVRISETIRVVWFSVRFSSFPCICYCCRKKYLQGASGIDARFLNQK